MYSLRPASTRTPLTIRPRYHYDFALHADLAYNNVEKR
jgi:hypothetical protein